MFDFFRKRRAALAEERRQEREFQLDLVKAMAQANQDAIEKLTSSVSEVAREMAAASKANSEIITTWLKSFQTAQAPYTSSFEDQEAKEEQARILEELKRDYPDFPTKLPPELQLAWELLRTEDPER